MRLTVCLCLSVCASLCLSVRVSVCLPVRLSVRLSVCLSVYVLYCFLYVCLFCLLHTKNIHFNHSYPLSLLSLPISLPPCCSPFPPSLPSCLTSASSSPLSVANSITNRKEPRTVEEITVTGLCWHVRSSNTDDLIFTPDQELQKDTFRWKGNVGGKVAAEGLGFERVCVCV